MDQVREQMELTNEISEAISNPLGMTGVDVDEVSTLFFRLFCLSYSCYL